MERRQEHELHQLLGSLLDGRLTGAEEARLGELLVDAEARELYRRYCVLHADLAQTFSLLPEVTPERVSKPRHSRRRFVAYAGALAASILALVAGLFWYRPAEEAPVVDGTGQVLLIDDQDKSAVRPGQAMAASQTLQTVGDDSRAVLTYRDATKLTLGANTTLQLSSATNGPKRSKPSKKVFLREGVLTADVSRQPSDQPMILTTPHAELLVVGTRFWIGTTADATRVEVEEGAVQFRNKASDSAVSLGAGEQAVAAPPNHAALEEAFDSLDHVRAYRGYRSRDVRLTLERGDHKEGVASVRADFTSQPQGYGTGGIEKTFAETNMTGRTFRVWLKPLTPDICGTLAVSLYDSRGLRAEVRFVHLTADKWVQMTIPVGEKGNWASHQKHDGADFTRINRIEFYGITRAGNQKAALLVDGFEEIKGK